MTAETRGSSRSRAAEHGRDADRPGEIPARGWRDILLRVFENTSRDNVLIIAAGMAFFAFLAIPPGLTALVSLYGLLSDPVDIEDQLHDFLGVLPNDTIRLVSHQLMAIAENSSSTLSTSFIVSVAGRSGAPARELRRSSRRSTSPTRSRRSAASSNLIWLPWR